MKIIRLSQITQPDGFGDAHIDPNKEIVSVLKQEKAPYDILVELIDRVLTKEDTIFAGRVWKLFQILLGNDIDLKIFDKFNILANMGHIKNYDTLKPILSAEKPSDQMEAPEFFQAIKLRLNTAKQNNALQALFGVNEDRLKQSFSHIVNYYEKGMPEDQSKQMNENLVDIVNALKKQGMKASDIYDALSATLSPEQMEKLIKEVPELKKLKEEYDAEKSMSSVEFMEDKDVEEAKNDLLDRYNRSEISKEKLQYMLKEFARGRGEIKIG